MIRCWKFEVLFLVDQQSYNCGLDKLLNGWPQGNTRCSWIFKTEFETVTTCSQGWFLMRTLGWHDINYHNKMTDMRSVIDIVIYYSGFVTHFDRYFSMRLTNQNRIGISIKLNVHAFLVEISRIPVCCEVSFVLWIYTCIYTKSTWQLWYGKDEHFHKSKTEIKFWVCLFHWFSQSGEYAEARPQKWPSNFYFHGWTGVLNRSTQLAMTHVRHDICTVITCSKCIDNVTCLLLVSDMSLLNQWSTIMPRWKHWFSSDYQS